MKKKYLYSLLVPYLMSAGALTSCENPRTNASNMPTLHKKVYVYKYKQPDLKVRIDTLNVTDKNFKQITTTGAAGVFFSNTNTVVVYHFNAATDSSYIVNYCDFCNNQRPLYMRHELEHARKKNLTHNTDRFSQISRAEIAAINEIVAPASEIIEAVDYHARTGKRFPSAKAFITQADSAITQALGGGILPGYVNYNYRPVADIVIKYATENFINSVGRGYYKHTIRKAYNRKTPLMPKKYTDPITYFTFNPDYNKWEPLWDFESNAGKCNPYRNASWSVRQKLIERVDSVVCSVTNADQNMLVLQKTFLR